MTTLAAPAERALVNIIGHVTIAANGRKLLVLVAMAGSACKSGVRAGQREVRLGIVVEYPVLPCAGVVAGRTIGSQRTVMWIVLPVTVDAGRRRVLESWRGVALRAGDRGVLAD